MFSKSKIKVSFIGFMVFVYQGLFSLSVVSDNIVYLILNKEFKSILEVTLNVPYLLLSFAVIYLYIDGLGFHTIRDIHLHITTMALIAPFIGAAIVTGAVSLYLMIKYYMTVYLVYGAWGLRFILISVAFSSISALIFYIRDIDKTL